MQNQDLSSHTDRGWTFHDDDDYNDDGDDDDNDDAYLLIDWMSWPSAPNRTVMNSLRAPSQKSKKQIIYHVSLF